jgi:hypothetical protein
MKVRNEHGDIVSLVSSLEGSGVRCACRGASGVPKQSCSRMYAVVESLAWA